MAYYEIFLKITALRVTDKVLLTETNLVKGPQNEIV